MFGSGCVGFDVCELPWRPTRLDEQKQFLLAVIDAGLVRARTASHESLIDRLEGFRGYVVAVDACNAGELEHAPIGSTSGYFV